MNERIKEIAIKAQLEHCVSHVRLEDFANLIIEECMQLNRQRLIPSPLWENDEYNKSHNRALWCAIGDMKEYLL